MTADEIENLVRAGDAQKLLDALPDVVESERTNLAKLAVSLTKSVGIGDHWKNNSAECCANLAVFGLGSWEQVKRLRRDLRHLWSNNINLYDWIPQFLTVRRPGWIERWVTHQLSDSFNPAWSTVRKLVRDGVCPTPTDDNYIIQLAHHYWSEKLAGNQWQLVDSLRADPGLLEHEIWRFFEVEPPGKAVLLYAHDLEGHAMSWSKAFKTLAASKEIDRDRLLTESLMALRRGRRAAGAAWFLRFHEYLEPTVDERVERQSLYIDLLSNAVPAVVAFAIEALRVVAKENRLDVRSCVDAIPRVFEIATKGVPIAAIKFLGTLVKQHPDVAEAAAVAACPALRHNATDVQKTAVTWLESLNLGPNEAIFRELDNAVESVAPSMRLPVEQIRKRMVANASTASSTSLSRPSELKHAECTLRETIAGLTNAQRTASGIDAGLRVLEHGGELEAVPIDPLKMIHLLTENELRPIVSLDELIDELSSAIERPMEPDQFERLLDGLSRLCDRRPPDFAIRTAPLLHRTLKLSDRVDRHLSFLVATWCQPAANISLRERPRADRTILGFLADRIKELGRRVRQGHALPLLSAPTHRNGWLSPMAFVDRLLVRQQTDEKLETFDLIQALLRLAPDQRIDALQLAERLVGDIRPVVRFALGATADATVDEIRQHPALWIAAGRGRDPSISLAELLPKIDGPDTRVPAVYNWRPVRRPKSLDGIGRWHLKIQLDVTPAFGSEGYRPHLATLKLHSSDWGVSECIGATMHRVWPINPDPTFATGAVAIARELDAPASTLRPTTEFLEPLFAPQTRFSEMAQLLVAVSLLAKDAGLKVSATDAVIVMIEDGRCVGDELGSVFRKLLISDAVKCNRLAEQLHEVARVSLLHQHACARLVQTMFGDTTALPNGVLPNDSHHLLGALNEWLVALDEPLQAATRDVLATLTGSSKTTKLAKSLLARTSPIGATQRHHVVLASLQGRLPRAPFCPR